MDLRALLLLWFISGLLRVAAAPALTPWFSNSYAIVVGVNNYTNSAWPRLNYAVNDAKGFAEFLSTQGFEVVSLLDSNATKQAIVSAVEDKVAGKLTANDRVVFFFAGHGATRLIAGEDRGYLVPYDGTIAYGSQITMNQIHDWSSAMSAAKHQMFILDSCFGGLVATRASTVDPRTPNFVDDITTRKARQVLTAGGANQRVADGGPNGHSLFTGQLLKALSEGIADQNGDGYITFTELVSYIQPAASQYNQTPGNCELAGHEQGNFLFWNPRFRRVSRDESGGTNTPLAGFRSLGAYQYLKTGKQLFVRKHYADSLVEFQRAADMGNAEAMTFLGKLYYDGLGVAIDKPKALELLVAAAERGDTLAMDGLSAHYGPNSTYVNAAEEARWKIALAEAKALNIVFVDPSGSAGKGEPTVPVTDILVRPLPPVNLRVIGP